MAWWRAQDDLAENPKTAQLTDGQFRTWIRVLGYAARIRTDGVLELAVLRKNLPRTTRKFVEKCLELRLLDRVENCPNLVQVHNWKKYHPTDPTGAERARRYREKHSPTTQLDTAERHGERHGERNGPDRDASGGGVTGHVTVPGRARPVVRPPNDLDQDRGLSTETVTVPPPSELDQPRATPNESAPNPEPRDGLGDGTGVELTGIENLQPLTGSVRDQLNQKEHT